MNRQCFILADSSAMQRPNPPLLYWYLSTNAPLMSIIYSQQTKQVSSLSVISI